MTTEHIRYWDDIKPTSQTRLADDVVDAILRDVFQGKKDHLRDHARAVAYKAVRGHEWPYFEECVEKAVAERLATKVVRADAHPGEINCDGCIHGPGCRVIPCTDCGSNWHMLGLIDPPPFICNRCWDVRDEVTPDA